MTQRKYTSQYLKMILQDFYDKQKWFQMSYVNSSKHSPASDSEQFIAQDLFRSEKRSFDNTVLK